MLNCRVHRGAELDTDGYLLVSSCRLQLSQPRASQPKPRGGYSSGLLHDAMMQKKYAVMITDELHHLCSMVGRPDSTPETLWQQYKSGLQRCADTLLRREAQPRAPWMSDKTWACVRSKRDSYKALKHALSEYEKSACQKILNECKKISQG